MIRTFSLARIFALMVFLLPAITRAQNKKPMLVVGIVVDQMRNEYLYRYWDRFGEKGFRKLIREGFHFRNTHYNYVPTYTGPGHASVFTGTTPRSHGIIGNDWYQRGRRGGVPCVYDTLLKSVGTEGGEGKASPRNLLCNTIGDELRLSTNNNSKVFGIAIKDRSAILPAGRSANGAFWLDGTGTKFISSSWYMNDLPKWLKDFNAQNNAAKMLAGGWSPLYPEKTYTASVADENIYEISSNKKEKPTFPYDYKKWLDKNELEIIKATPFGNTITKDVAKACIAAEELGRRGVTDMITISFSSTDMVAHDYGPRAMEVEDMYLRLDKDIEDLLAFLNSTVGEKNYVLFLTADHGGAEVTTHMSDNRLATGNIYERGMRQDLRKACYQQFGDSTIVLSYSNEQIFVDEQLCEQKKLDVTMVENWLIATVTRMPGVAEAYSSRMLRSTSFPERDIRTLLQNGLNFKRSGQICVVYQPGWHDHGPKGTTHGSGYNYDTHVPLIFYGAGLPVGETTAFSTITQIAPTVCELVRINQAGCTTSNVLSEITGIRKD